MNRILVLGLSLGLAACAGDEPEWLAAAIQEGQDGEAVASAEAGVTANAGAEAGARVTANAGAEAGARVTANAGAEAGAGLTPDPGVAEADGAQPVGGDRASQGPAERRVVFVDVRRPDEWAAGRVEGALHIPLAELPDRWAELEAYREDDIVLYCRTGNRSGTALQMLREAGFDRLHNGGGLTDLERKGVPVVR